MNTFKRKALTAAVLAGLGVACAAEAMPHRPGTTGQVLIYPYYTVPSAADTPFSDYVNAVNALAEPAEVRVVESRTSSEVFDVNLFIPPKEPLVPDNAS